MRRIPIEYAKEGDILGRTLYNNMGGMLLKEGSRLNQSIINKLKIYGCFNIYIKDRYTEEVIEEIIKPETMNRIHSLQENLKGIIRNSTNGEKIDTKGVNKNVRDINEIIEEIVYDVIFSKNILEDLVNISIYDDYTLNHSINVMMLATVIARDNGFNMSDIKKLAVGCIFHDIGKTFIPIEIINKPSKLTKEEFEYIKTHTEKGYEFLINYTDLPVVSSNIALCHHEREDGLGYPRKLKGNEIHKFSKIASICDVFDALTSDRSYRRAAPIHEAMEYLLAVGGTQFSVDIIKSFSQSINIFPKDTLVHLSDGREGIVCEVNHEFHTRPKVKIYGENGKEVSPYIVDLMNTSNIVVDKVLHIFSFDQNK